MAKAARLKSSRSSGNVFADLGLPDAEILRVKSDIIFGITQIISELGLSQTKVADLTGLTQPDVSNLLRGKVEGYSLERLLNCYLGLGRSITINATPKAKPRIEFRELEDA